MSKEIYIKLKDGEKESEMKMVDVEPQHQLALMDGVFRFFDLDIDFKEMADVYHRSGKAYKEFFDGMDTEEAGQKDEKTIVNSKEKVKPKSNVTAEQFEAAYQEKPAVEETKQVASNKVESKVEGYHPEYEFTNDNYYATGIKYDSLNRPLYRVRYKCPRCKDESNKYVKSGTKEVQCWQCSKKMDVRPATVHGAPQKEKDPNLFRDQNGNFYIAGSFEQDVTTMSDIEKRD
jgi:DNA-directed RNA polymerase subunit RPC12/RpoP